MHFEILGEISGLETFATGSDIREIARLRRIYGRGRWRKRKGIAACMIVDESGEDYLYPKAFFRSIALPQSVRRAVLAA